MNKLSLVLKKQPWLRLIDIRNVSSRLLGTTSGDIFIAYNTINDSYELHACSNYDEQRNSCNAVIPDEMLGGVIVKDYKANNHRKNAQRLEDERAYNNFLYEKAAEKTQHSLTSERINIVARTLGRQV